MRPTPARMLLAAAWLVWAGVLAGAGSPGMERAAPAGAAPAPPARGAAASAQAATPGMPAPPPAAPAQLAPRAFIERTCLGCHNDRTRAGGLTLAGVDPLDVAAHAELGELVLHKVRTGQMPPPGAARPDPAIVQAFVAALEATLDAAAAAHPQPGRVGVHRLNRAEYANAIRDLLALEIDARALLLPDEADEGFDNVAASLAVSPAHLERYLASARTISRLAVGDEALGRTAAATTYRVPKLLEQDVRLGDEMPFGSRGGVAVRHHFPLDGAYVFTVRLRRQVYDYIIGLGQRQLLELRIDGRRVARFRVGGESTGMPGPLTWNGEIVGDTEYELYSHAADAGLEARVRVEAGTRTITASFVATPWEIDGVPQPPAVDFGRGSDERYDGHAAVDALTIAGPYAPGGAGDTPSRRAIFTCVPAQPAEERACAERILARLARRAYRRPVAAADLEPLLAFYDAAHGERGFEAGIQAALERLLVSAHFLFRVDQDPPGVRPGAPYRLSDIDLASRLSFFLWRTIPDEPLLDLAERGRLSDPAVLAQQIQRMLADPRARALAEHFGSQWLGVRKAQRWLPDPNAFPEFDENLRRALIEETTRFLESQIREDRSILELLTADYSYVDERLARHYGLSGVTGERFRRVRFGDGVRGGLLGQGAILMVTSYPNRTAPVLRGLWVLDTLLGMPPPPPPPNVPELEPVAPDGRPLTMREQMERHRQNPACASCHVRMDPLGLALEHFDAIGRWRTHSHGAPIDASAVFADGTPIEGAAGLRAFVLSRRDDYVRAFAGKLLTYAVGRQLDHRDQPWIRSIVREAARDGHRWSAVILAIVTSPPFQMRSAAS